MEGSDWGYVHRPLTSAFTFPRLCDEKIRPSNLSWVGIVISLHSPLKRYGAIELLGDLDVDQLQPRLATRGRGENRKQRELHALCLTPPSDTGLQRRGYETGCTTVGGGRRTDGVCSWRSVRTPRTPSARRQGHGSRRGRACREKGRPPRRAWTWSGRRTPAPCGLPRGVRSRATGRC